jgi:DNA-binding HxlR family transcriptional regulator
MPRATPKPGTPVPGSTTGRPIMVALNLFSRRWMLRVIWELHQQPAGFRELQRRCDQMSSSVLSTRLVELSEAGLVVDEPDGYHLTKAGHDLVKAMAPLETWSIRWARSLT